MARFVEPWRPWTPRRKPISSNMGQVLPETLPASSCGQWRPHESQQIPPSRDSQHIACLARRVVTGRQPNLMRGAFGRGAGTEKGSVFGAILKPQPNRVIAELASSSAGPSWCTAPAKHPKSGNLNTTHTPERGTRAHPPPNAAEIFSTAVAKHVIAAVQPVMHAPQRGIAEALSLSPADPKPNAAPFQVIADHI